MMLVFTGTAQAKLADTLDELEQIYPTPDTCKVCHADIHTDWDKSLHKTAITHILPGLNAYLTVGIEKEPERKARVAAGKLKDEMMKCFACHAPMMQDASDKLVKEIYNAVKTSVKKDDPGAADAKKKLARIGVTCYVCHNTKSVHPPDAPDKGTMYGLKGTGQSPAHKIQKGRFLDNPIFCMQCHGVFVAPDGENIMCNTLSQSYRDNYVAQGGQDSCQNCHMKKEGGKTFRNHRFPGAYDLAMLKEGIGMNVSARAIKDAVPGVAKWIPAAAITIDLVNRAGHRIPDG
jgi:hypothetical protein